MKSDFQPKHIKRATEALDKHLKTVGIHENTNKEYKKGILKESSLWDKVLHLFKA